MAQVANFIVTGAFKFLFVFVYPYQFQQSSILDKSDDLLHVVLTEDKYNKDFLQSNQKIRHSLCIRKNNNVNNSLLQKN